MVVSCFFAADLLSTTSHAAKRDPRTPQPTICGRVVESYEIGRVRSMRDSVRSRCARIMGGCSRRQTASADDWAHGRVGQGGGHDACRGLNDGAGPSAVYRYRRHNHACLLMRTRRRHTRAVRNVRRSPSTSRRARDARGRLAGGVARVRAVRASSTPISRSRMRSVGSRSARVQATQRACARWASTSGSTRSSTRSASTTPPPTQFLSRYRDARA